MKELVFDELSLEQKIGLVLCAHPVFGQADDEYTLKLIKERRLGAVWANPTRADFIKRIKETADYPIIIVCDAENGHGNEGTIPQLISITAAGGKDEYAYSFGRTMAKGVTCFTFLWFLAKSINSFLAIPYSESSKVFISEYEQLRPHSSAK